ncbi:hypothetical protein H9X85_02500 [Anaerotignum lactatifermentans]|uniref:Uncharacterized protein n=1 Tax=Anaerotignum lactatifermentans TaxID=160404 RepID=A0ABS2G8X1_9FIRM|nr:hypothetical protein [Anaerotignum lactatifermentans]MBM6828504.1 hypothetical protein [Anaerotignum lactatifermentans]MBM6877911.1 hypothetical protein [Anaerotignum lactatifermentans]MBM6950086.1 hypothetical protein [Anaerotignum lactatifermentans]
MKYRNCVKSTWKAMKKHDILEKTRTDVPIFEGVRGMVEKYREAIIEMINTITDEKILKKIYSYILSIKK